MPFDFNPNTKLPGGGRTYRIKDGFLAKYRTRTSRYTKDRVDDAKSAFFTIFADNRLIVYQAHDEVEKMKMISEHEYYEVVTSSDKVLSTNANTTDNNTDTATNKSDRHMASGQISGSLDTVQMEAEALEADLEHVDVDKISDIFDKNHRQINQGISRDKALETVTVSSTSEGNKSVSTTGRGNTLMKQRNMAANQIRAHSVVLRRLRTEFLECFSVMFW